MNDNLTKYLALRTQLANEQNKLESRLKAITAVLGSNHQTKPATQSTTTATKPKRAKRKISAAGRAKISAAQKARWTKIKAAKAAKPKRTGKRKVSAATRAKMVASGKARWAKAKEAKPAVKESK